MTAHWGPSDSGALEGSEAVRGLAFDDIYRMLNQSISIFINLPLQSLTMHSLQRQLDQIGKAGSAATAEPA